MKSRCRHPWNSLSLIYSGDGCLIERIGCAKCNKNLFPKILRGSCP
jgi:hypothetical protein